LTQKRTVKRLTGCAATGRNLLFLKLQPVLVTIIFSKSLILVNILMTQFVQLEMERALIDGEWQMQCEKLAHEEDHLIDLRLRLEQLDRDVTTARLCEARHLADCRARMEQGEHEVRR